MSFILVYDRDDAFTKETGSICHRSFSPFDRHEIIPAVGAAGGLSEDDKTCVCVALESPGYA